MAWVKTIGIFLKGLFQFLNNPQRYEWKNKKWEVKKPVKIERAENRVEKLDYKGEKRKKKRSKKALKRAKRYKK